MEPEAGISDSNLWLIIMLANLVLVIGGGVLIWYFMFAKTKLSNPMTKLPSLFSKKKKAAKAADSDAGN